jgi:flagellar basal-body rod protein FlgB
MLHAVDAKRQHDRALAIYKFSLGILRTSLGRR